MTFIDSTNSLGVLYPGYSLGQPIKVEAGNVQTITVYNGKAAGPLQFMMKMSNAYALAVSWLLVVAGLFYL